MKWEQAQNAGAALNRLDLTRQSYSQRNAVVGSTFTAFASGTIQAASAAPITITAVQIKVIGSVACTPNNRVGKVLDSTRERATAHNTPMVSPIITTLITWETTESKNIHRSKLVWPKPDAMRSRSLSFSDTQMFR